MTTWWTKCWVVFAVTLPAAVLAAEPGEFEKLRADYEMGRTNISAGLQADIAKIRTSYANGLGDLSDSLRQQGNLDGVLAVKEEQKQLEEHGVTACLEKSAALPALAAVQKSHWAYLDQARQTCDAQLATLLANYRVRLKALVVTLTKDNRIDEAVKARAELESLPAAPLVALPAELAKNAVLLMSFERDTVIPAANGEARSRT